MTEKNTNPLSVVILAAGQGTRMRSQLPKVLHEVAGKPLLAHVIGTATRLGAEAIHVVYGHGGAAVQTALAGLHVNWVEQSEQLGTGHAVAQAIPHIPGSHRVLILYGDVPLIGQETLERLVTSAGNSVVSLLTAEVDDPDGYGRILLNVDGNVSGIVEQKDASKQQLAIREINTGMLSAPAAKLDSWLKRLSNDNAQGEYYLTDVIAMAAAEGVAVHSVRADNEEEILGVNDRSQLAYLERCYQANVAHKLMSDGVTLRDPKRIDVRGDIQVGTDIVIDINVVFEGRVVLGSNVHIGANCVLRDVVVGEGTVILPNCVVENSEIGDDCQIGPFTRIRPDSILQAGVKLGNFVETKKTSIGRGSKINHLSYIGDATVGNGVNVGAGCITCNYDGANKYQTVIGDGAFIGSDCQLVAPVKIGERAYVGAGSTITKDAPPEQLSVSRSKQIVIKGWKPPKKAKN